MTFAVTVAGASVGNPFLVGAGLGSRALLGAGRAALAARHFGAAERAVIGEARGILNSPQFARGVEALKTGIDLDLKIGGRTILVRPGLPSSGMTLFEEGGFVIGRQAISSSSELGKTVLQELFRLQFSAQGGGVGVGMSAVETRAAFQFAERAIGLIR